MNRTTVWGRLVSNYMKNKRQCHLKNMKCLWQLAHTSTHTKRTIKNVILFSLICFIRSSAHLPCFTLSYTAAWFSSVFNVHNSIVVMLIYRFTMVIIAYLIHFYSFITAKPLLFYYSHSSSKRKSHTHTHTHASKNTKESERVSEHICVHMWVWFSLHILPYA